MTDPTIKEAETVRPKYIQQNQNTCSGSRRLFAGLIDVSVISLITSLIMFFFFRLVQNNLSQESHDFALLVFVIALCAYYFLFFLNYFLYQCITFLLFRTTLGLRMFGVKIVREGEEPKFSEFVFRIMLITLFFSFTCLVGLIILPLVYYFLTINDPYSGPFWDFELRPSDSEHTEPIQKMKYIITYCTNVLAIYFIGYNLVIGITNVWDSLIEVSTSFLSAFDASYDETNIDTLYQNYQDGEYDYIIEHVESQVDIYALDPDVLNIYGIALIETRQTEKAIEIYEFLNTKRISGYPGIEDFVTYNLGLCYYNLEKFAEAEAYFREFLKVEPEDVETLVYLAWCIVLNTEDNEEAINSDRLKFDEGIEYLEKALKISNESTFTSYSYLDFLNYCGYTVEAKHWIEQKDVPSDYESQMTLADLYDYASYYLEAADIYEEILSKDNPQQLTHEQWESALNRLMSSYFSCDYFDEVIALCKEYESEVSGFNLYQWWGNSLFEVGEDNSAKEKMNKAVAFDSTVTTYEDRMLLEVYQGDLDAALYDVEKAKQLGMSEDEYAYHYELIHNQLELTPGEQIFKFVDKNYMYRDFLTNPDYIALKNELSKKESLIRNDFERINTQFGQEDIFSFILYDEWYNDDNSLEAMHSVTVNKAKKSILYIKIDYFNMLTDIEFLRALKSVEKTKDKTLVIDLRGNGGGDTSSAYNILDYLIGVTYLGSWEAFNEDDESYYSDGNVFEFKKIFVLVDDETASSAEIVTLGLKEFVDDTIIIGETTLGKGVGQKVFVNMTERFALYVVNAYWMIGTKNIHGIGIEPDIQLKDATLQAYMAIVRKSE